MHIAATGRIRLSMAKWRHPKYKLMSLNLLEFAHVKYQYRRFSRLEYIARYALAMDRVPITEEIVVRIPCAGWLRPSLIYL